jgi:hypothetical protein
MDVRSHIVMRGKQGSVKRVQAKTPLEGPALGEMLQTLS